MKSLSTPFHFYFYLVLLSVLGFLATDMYLPAFEAMRTDLNTSKGVIGASLTVFLGGFALGQLFWGGFSDKHGKPKAIGIGLIIFGLSTLMIVFTTSISILLALRLVQAFGACAASVCWQALIVERFPKEQTSKLFASIMPLVALSPALAPILGALLLDAFGWRSIFIALVLFAVFLLLYTRKFIDNSAHLSSKKEVNIEEKVSYFSFLKSPKYIGNVLIYSFGSAAFFAWLTGSPFILHDLGYSKQQIGLCFIPQTITFLLGGYSYRMVADRVDNRKVLLYLIVLFSLSLLATAIVVLFTQPNLLSLLIPLSVMAFANGASYPIAVNSALKEYSTHAGKASALLNFIQLGACFIASMLVSLFSSTILLTTTLVILSTIFFSGFGLYLSRKF